MVSAIERCPLFLSAIKRFFYETMTMIPSVLMNSVRYREVSAIKLSAIERFHSMTLTVPLLNSLEPPHTLVLLAITYN